MKFNTLVAVILFTVALTFLMTIVSSQGNDNPCTQATKCSTCLQAGGECYWCTDENFTTGANVQRPRCNKKPILETDEKCQNIVIEDGSVNVKPSDNVPFDSITQVRPQKIEIKLRPDQTRSFTIQVRPAKDFPVKLYYLMDMSKSMDDDLSKLQTLGQKIADSIETITANYSLGFGTFVDKTVSPFVQIEKLNEPCKGCKPTFGYRHNFNFNKDAKLFEEAVKKQQISGNLDRPEGGFDALMQVAVCTNKLGWGDPKKSRRLVVFVTDASPHIAGDGKIGGITVPNDGVCYLEKEGEDLKYTKSNMFDYPSISMLKAKLKENKIVPIYAVTSDVIDVYKKIVEEWEDVGAKVGPLLKDSSNVVELIRKNYLAIATTARLTDDSPKDIVVHYKVQPGCPKVVAENECTELKMEETVDFKVDITALKCSADWKTDRNFLITVPGFGDVEVNVKMICDCDCEINDVKTNSPKCNNTGDYQCGICKCPPDTFGAQCQCTSEDQADQTLCKRNTTEGESAVCSGFGTCICGECQCDRREDQNELISGRYCECNNFGCPRFEGLLCGGEERGVCDCGKCKCAEAYLGKNCGEKNCTIGLRNCIKDGAICSGNGQCACDRCECETGYKGTHCENCVSCPGKCKDSKECVLCQVFTEPSVEECAKKDCKLNIRVVNETDEKCAFKDDKDCYVIFSFEQDLITQNETVIVQRNKRCVVVVKKDPNILAIVLGTIGGIVLLGLILLLLWKLLITAYDNYEYHKFEKDRMKSKWENAENPIYRPSKQQFQNPTFAGNK